VGGVSPGNPFAIYLGAQKEPNSNTFFWSVGSRRGQPFFSAQVLPRVGDYQTPEGNPRFLDIQFENGFICHQEHCFDAAYFLGYSGVYDAETESVLLAFSPTNLFPSGSKGNYFTFADDAFKARYGVIENEDSGKIANANGGSKFIVSSGSLPWIEASNDANIAGTYLARIETDEQQQWILDEMQCTSSTFWLGYQQDHDGRIVKGPGPAQRQVLYDSVTGCTKDLYCKYTPPKKRTADEFPGITPSLAVYLDPVTKLWSSQSTSTPKRFLFQSEVCSFNANQFFRYKGDEYHGSEALICSPNPTNDWSSSRNVFAGNHAYFNEKSFFAGAGVYFTNVENDAKKLLYFDCHCNTDPIIDKACLGSDAWPGCALYTNALEYYLDGLYLQRLMDGIGYGLAGLLDYGYWLSLYQLQ